MFKSLHTDLPSGCLIYSIFDYFFSTAVATATLHIISSLQIIRVATCLACNDSSLYFTSNATVLFHLIKHHGKIYSERTTLDRVSGTLEILFHR